MKKLFAVFLLLFAQVVYAAPPSRTQTYVAGQVIDPSDVTENEDNIYEYLQAGVDRIATNAVETNDIQDAAVTTPKIGTGAVGSTQLTDDSIANVDISSTAAISASKLADNEIDGEELDETANFTWTGTHDFGDALIEVDNQADCSGVTAEGRVCWDSDNDVFYSGTGAAAQASLKTGIPAIVFGTSNTAGTATTGLATDATIAIFDDGAVPEDPSTASAGNDLFASRRDHVHKPSSTQWFEELGITTASVDTTFSGNAMTLNAADSNTTVLPIYRPAGLNTMDVWIMADTVNAGGNAQYAISFDNGSTCFPDCTGGTQATDNTKTQIVSAADVSGIASGQIDLYVMGQNDSGADAIEIEYILVVFR